MQIEKSHILYLVCSWFMLSFGYAIKKNHIYWSQIIILYLLYVVHWLMQSIMLYPTVITLSFIYCTVCILKNLCRAIQKALASQKWPAGPLLAAPAL
jgi:hypothetical protein